MTLRACLHGGGWPQVGKVKYGGSPHLSCKRDQIKMRDYMDKRVTPPKRVTSPTWGHPPPCKQALRSFVLRYLVIAPNSNTEKLPNFFLTFFFLLLPLLLSSFLDVLPTHLFAYNSDSYFCPKHPK